MEVVKTELLVRQLGKDSARVVLKWLETTLWDLKNQAVDVEDDQSSIRFKYKAQQVRKMGSDLKAIIDAG